MDSRRRAVEFADAGRGRTQWAVASSQLPAKTAELEVTGRWQLATGFGAEQERYFRDGKCE
jgi:hypothetical protein